MAGGRRATRGWRAVCGVARSAGGWCGLRAGDGRVAGIRTVTDADYRRPPHCGAREAAGYGFAQMSPHSAPGPVRSATR